MPDNASESCRFELKHGWHAFHGQHDHRAEATSCGCLPPRAPSSSPVKKSDRHSGAPPADQPIVDPNCLCPAGARPGVQSRYRSIGG